MACHTPPSKKQRNKGKRHYPPRFHQFKDVELSLFFSAEDHNISMLIWVMSVLQPFSHQLLPRCADTPSYIHTHHPSHQWYQQLHFTHNYINVVVLSVSCVHQMSSLFHIRLVYIHTRLSLPMEVSPASKSRVVVPYKFSIAIRVLVQL